MFSQALNFCKSRWYVGSTIIGATTLEQLREDCAAFEGEDLAEEVLAEIDAIHRAARNPNVFD
jgi:aryl-alcohol dehydrogenase-like predicted oxidoreductase